MTGTDQKQAETFILGNARQLGDVLGALVAQSEGELNFRHAYYEHEGFKSLTVTSDPDLNFYLNVSESSRRGRQTNESGVSVAYADDRGYTLMPIPYSAMRATGIYESLREKAIRSALIAPEALLVKAVHQRVMRELTGSNRSSGVAAATDKRDPGLGRRLVNIMRAAIAVAGGKPVVK